MAFASNLLGAMVGGALEYLALITGYQALLLVVAAALRAGLAVRDPLPAPGRPRPGAGADAGVRERHVPGGGDASRGRLIDAGATVSRTRAAGWDGRPAAGGAGRLDPARPQACPGAARRDHPAHRRLLPAVPPGRSWSSWAPSSSRASSGVINPLPAQAAHRRRHPRRRTSRSSTCYVGLMIVVPIISGLIGVGQTYLNNVVGQQRHAGPAQRAVRAPPEDAAALLHRDAHGRDPEPPGQRRRRRPERRHRHRQLGRSATSSSRSRTLIAMVLARAGS